MNECSWISCSNDAVYSAEVTEEDKANERKKYLEEKRKLAKQNRVIMKGHQDIRPTPGTYYYCEKHKQMVDDREYLRYLQAKIKPL